jgi:hypothetical protein
LRQTKRQCGERGEFKEFIMQFRRKSLIDMTFKPNSEERRFALRLALRLPIVVSGRADEGATWSEPTETENISTTGALFQLNQNVQVGDKLYIRSHRPDGIPVEVMAEVIRHASSSNGVAHVGVAVREAAEGWIRLFVAWVADDQPPGLSDSEEQFDETVSPLEMNGFELKTVAEII